MLSGGLVEILVSRVLGRIEPLTGRLVDPVVADHAVLVGMSARQKRGMTDAGIGRRMAVVIVAVPRALVEPQLEAARSVLVVILYQLLLRETVDDHEQDKLRQRLAARSAHLSRARLRKQQRHAGSNDAPTQPVSWLHALLPRRPYSFAPTVSSNFPCGSINGRWRKFAMRQTERQAASTAECPQQT